MAMAMELARVVHQERLMEAETRRQRRAAKRTAAERAALDGKGKQTGPKVDWPVFSVRIGRFHLAVFKTVRM